MNPNPVLFITWQPRQIFGNEMTNQLIQLIHNEIKREGLISFARFMELALYAPRLGYYTSPRAQIGKDFVTAPLLSNLFAKSVAKQCQQIFSEMGNEAILEIGAGSGQFAYDLLSELEKLNALPIHYFIFEKSDSLKAQQQELFKKSDWIDRVQWVKTYPKMEGIILANEVMDAFPVHLFRIKNNMPEERYVALEKDQFCTKWLPAKDELLNHIHLTQQECMLGEGYQSEINLNIKKWISGLSSVLEKGVMLLFDYGYGRREYYHPDRKHGTLMCFYHHQKNYDPFSHVGLQDITAHVDFTMVIESAIDAGLSLGGFTTQASFLLSCDVLEKIQREDNFLDYYEKAQQIKKLLFPSEMGELIKVMALRKGIDVPLKGFSLQDQGRLL